MGSKVPQIHLKTGEWAANRALVTAREYGKLILGPNVNGSVAAPVVTGTGLYNVNSQNTPHLRAAIARIRSSNGNARFGIAGDSTTVGAYATASGSGNEFNNVKVLAVPFQLAAILSARGIPAQNDNFMANGNVGSLANYTTYYPAVTSAVTGFAADGSFPIFGGFSFDASTNGATLAFEPVTAFDTIDVYYFTFSTLGSFTVNVDGGSTLATVNTGTGTGNVAKTTITGVSHGTHTINIVTSSGTKVYILGVAVRDSTTPRVEIYNLGGASATAEIYNSTANFGTIQALTAMALDVLFINLTINDINLQSASIATYIANLTSLISTQQAAGGDVVLMIGNPCNTAQWTSGGATSVAQKYMAAVYLLATSLNLPLIDITQRWVSYAAANAVMPYGDAGAGSLHPSKTGYADIADAISLVTQG